eukprot:1825893-Amphidinium_carterae.1
MLIASSHANVDHFEHHRDNGEFAVSIVKQTIELQFIRMFGAAIHPHVSADGLKQGKCSQQCPKGQCYYHQMLPIFVWGTIHTMYT